VNIALIISKPDPIDVFPSFGLMLKFVVINFVNGIPYGLGFFTQLTVFLI
jgi:hypothetical protein